MSHKRWSNICSLHSISNLIIIKYTCIEMPIISNMIEQSIKRNSKMICIFHQSLKFLKKTVFNPQLKTYQAFTMLPNVIFQEIQHFTQAFL